MEDVLRELQKAWNLTQEFDGPQMYAGTIKSDLELVETLCTKDTYADIVQALTELPAYARLAAAQGAMMEVCKNRHRSKQQESR